MICAFIIAHHLVQTKPRVIADQSLKLKITMLGEIGTPVGNTKDAVINGKLDIKNISDPKSKQDIYRLSLKVKRDDLKIVTVLTEGLPEKKDQPEMKADAFREGKYACFVNTFGIAREDATLTEKQTPDVSDLGNFQSAATLLPFSLALAITQKSLVGPDLKKEYFLAQDGPRKYYVTFRPNLNANTDSSKGEAAYKFNLKLVDGNGTAPNLFDGAIRLNVFSGKVQYITATSAPENWKTDSGESFFSSLTNIAIRFDSEK